MAAKNSCAPLEAWAEVKEGLKSISPGGSISLGKELDNITPTHVLNVAVHNYAVSVDEALLATPAFASGGKDHEKAASIESLEASSGKDVLYQSTASSNHGGNLSLELCKAALFVRLVMARVILAYLI